MFKARIGKIEKSMKPAQLSDVDKMRLSIAADRFIYSDKLDHLQWQTKEADFDKTLDLICNDALVSLPKELWQSAREVIKSALKKHINEHAM